MNVGRDRRHVRGRHTWGTYLPCLTLFLANFIVYRNVVAFRQQAQVRNHQKRGRQGSGSRKSKLSQRQQDCIKWRRIIRAVHWRRFDEVEILSRAMNLARFDSPGDQNIPKWVHSMYHAMERYIIWYSDCNASYSPLAGSSVATKSSGIQKRIPG